MPCFHLFDLDQFVQTMVMLEVSKYVSPPPPLQSGQHLIFASPFLQRSNANFDTEIPLTGLKFSRAEFVVEDSRGGPSCPAQSTLLFSHNDKPD